MLAWQVISDVFAGARNDGASFGGADSLRGLLSCSPPAVRASLHTHAALCNIFSALQPLNPFLAGIGLLMQQDLDPDSQDGTSQNKVPAPLRLLCSRPLRQDY